MTDVVLEQTPCPICDGTLPRFTFRWYCVPCDALMKKPSRKAGWKHWHKTSKGICDVPMIYVQTLISCPHQYTSHHRDIALLNSWQPVVPGREELFPTETERTRKKRAQKRAQMFDKTHAQNVIDAGQTPVDPDSYI